MPACLMASNGAETLVLVIKGSWSITKKSTLVISEKQAPINTSAIYNGKPGVSSLLYDTDMVLEKPGTDCVLLGQAYAPTKNTRQMVVTLAVGPVKKTVMVFGNRRWTSTFGLIRKTDPEPFETIPLTYEFAFGGNDTSQDDPACHERCDKNPVGVGFRAKRSRLTVSDLVPPNLEDPSDLIQNLSSRPNPACFGMVAPAWQQRSIYAGTYDEQWQKNRSPLLPTDFDSRFYCSASSGLISTKHLIGNEEFFVENAWSGGRIKSRLPGISPNIRVRLGMKSTDLHPKLDTIVIEPDREQIQLVWRASLDVHKKVHEIGWIRVT